MNGKPLYFRGHENLKTAITEIDLLYNLSTFSEVALSGCSAGGLSAYLHADYVASRLPPSVGKFGVVPVSGYFMDHLNVLSTAVYVPAPLLTHVSGLLGLSELLGLLVQTIRIRRVTSLVLSRDIRHLYQTHL